MNKDLLVIKILAELDLVEDRPIPNEFADIETDPEWLHLNDIQRVFPKEA